MTPEQEKWADKIYTIGFRNGQVAMRNRVLQKINHDWTLVTIKPPMDLIMKILKNVSKIRINSPKL